MPACGKKTLSIGFAGLMLFGALGPASAQGLFERIFGGIRRAIEAPLPAITGRGHDDPFAGIREAAPRNEGGPSKAFCVRTCDGRYFPVQAHAGMTAAEACHTFCPASETRIYSGGNIDYATAPDGSRYAGLSNAYLYRKQLVPGCTCNGRTAFGLAHVDVRNDPTLKSGDIVATKSGLAAYSGKTAEFTPVESYRGLSKNTREKLSDVKVSTPNQPRGGGRSAAPSRSSSLE